MRMLRIMPYTYQHLGKLLHRVIGAMSLSYLMPLYISRTGETGPGPHGEPVPMPLPIAIPEPEPNPLPGEPTPPVPVDRPPSPLPLGDEPG
jgi:hypothetical protein